MDTSNLDVVYRSLVEQSPIGFIIFDKTGKIIQANHSTLKILRTSLEKLIGRSYLDVKDKNISGMLHRALHNGETLEYEGPYETTISSLSLYIHLHCAPFFDQEKNIMGLSVSFEDMTQRKETEAKLETTVSERIAAEVVSKENEIKFRTLFHAAGEAIFLMDERIFLECNPMTEEMFRCKREEIVGASPVDFSPEFQPDGKPSAVKAVEKISLAFAGKSQTFDWVHCRKDRTTFDAEVTLTSVTLNGKKFLQAIVRDISERKKAEEEIRKLNEELEQKVVLRTEELKATNRYLENTNRDLLATLDELKSTQAQLIQSEKMAVLGQLIAGIAHEVNTPLGAIISSNEGIQSVFRNDWEELLCDYAEFNEKERDTWAQIFSKGSIFPEFYDSAEERKNRKAIREELLKHKYASLDSLSENLAELGIGPNDLPELMKQVSKEKFPIIVSNASSLSGILRHSNVIREAAIKAAGVIRALKTYVYQDQSGVGIIDIREQIDIVLTLYYNKAKFGVEITRNFAENSLVRGQADQLTQVWANLINNAFQAISYQGKLELESYLEGDCLIVSVTDNGPGVPEGIREKIFEPFFTTKAQGEGSGLGLDICKKIVERHKGKIEFTSEPGRTSFRVSLPLAESKI